MTSAERTWSDAGAEARRARLAGARARCRGPLGHVGAIAREDREDRQQGGARLRATGRQVQAHGALLARRAGAAAGRHAHRGHPAEDEAAALREERPWAHHGLARHARLGLASPAPRLPRWRGTATSRSTSSARCIPGACGSCVIASGHMVVIGTGRAQAQAEVRVSARAAFSDLADAHAALDAGMGGERRDTREACPTWSRSSARPSTARRRTIWPTRSPTWRPMPRSSEPARPTA